MRPVLLFDGDCGFCTKSASFIVRHIRPAADVVPYQNVDLSTYGLTTAQAAAAIRFVDAYGRTTAGGPAIRAMLATASLRWRIIGRKLGVPGISRLFDNAYRVIARNRYRLPGSTPACKLPEPNEFSPGGSPSAGDLPR